MRTGSKHGAAPVDSASDPLWVKVAGVAALVLNFSPSGDIRSSRAMLGRGDGGDGRGGAARRHGRDAAEPGRGRGADSPEQIPGRGWKDIVLRTYEDMNNHRLLAVAAGVTFYGLLALFPFIGSLVSLYGLFFDVHDVQQQIKGLANVLPGGALEVIGGEVERIAQQGGGKLGLSFAIGLAVSLWSANGGMKAMFDALNVAYDEKEQRSFIRLNLQSLCFTLLTVVFLIVSLALIAVLPNVLGYIVPGPTAQWVISLVRWPLLLAFVGFALAVLYRFAPDRDEPKWRWVSPGSAFAAIGWLIFSMLFSWYAAHFGSYNKTYGSLGAVIGFMTWLWLSVTIVLIGAELNAETEHQTARDSTSGPRAPMGSRGARVADTLGAARG